MYACSTSSYANHKLWWSVSAKKANLWCPQLAWNLRLKVCLVPVVFGILMALGNIVWKPGEREICGEVEQGLGVVFFPRYTSKSSRKNCPSLTFWSNVGDISRFSGDVRTAQRSIFSTQTRSRKHPLHRWVVSPSTQCHRFIDSASLFLCISHVFTVGSNSKLRPWPPFSEIGCFICAPVCQRGATGADGVGLCLCHNVWAFRRKKRQIC